MRTAIRVVGTAGLVLSLAVSARAEPIQIAAGSLIGTMVTGGGARVTLIGEGFTFEGRTGNGVFGPGDCVVPECVGGTTVDLHAFWTGLDLLGTATVDGITYLSVGSAASPSSASAEWTGRLLIPADFEGGVLTAPFLFSGFVIYASTLLDATNRVDLVGQGQATLTFTPFSDYPGAFRLTAYRYDFGADPVPEPASMILLGTGLAGLAALRRRARTARRTE